MSADFPPSNPFRRKGPSPTFAASQNPSTIERIPSHHEKHIPNTTPIEKYDATKLQTKTVKKVRVQSPPPSSLEADPWSAAPITQDDTTTTPHYDPFESATSDTSDDETSAPSAKQAPINPFQKTLQTMEGGIAAGPPTSVTSPGKASLDVDAFKRLLMTGNAGLSSSTSSSTPTVHTVHHTPGDGGSSTDTSSLSRQSIFEPIQETHPESPRTSHEISEPEDGTSMEHKRMSTSNRKKPPPPSSRHGKSIKLELRDELTPSGMNSPPTPSSAMSQQYFNSSTASLPSSVRSQTDLNKPLPPAPRRFSHESDRESVFDKEAAGKAPEPPSPSASLRRKTPPTPPLARRHSQLVSDSRLTRNDSGRLSPKVEEDNVSRAETVPGRTRSDSAKIPPPPPSRRPGSIKTSNPVPLSPPSSSSGPPVPPTRMSSTRQRPPSVSSVDMSTSRRSTVAPPPPPPHRHGRSSMDAQRPMLSPDSRASGEFSRRSIDSSGRNSAASPTPKADGSGTSSGDDALAALSALQREIDALRGQSEKQVAP